MAYYKCGKIFATQNSNTSIETASGAIANFNTSLAMPVLGCNAEFSASQAEGTPTPSAPIPIVGVDKVNVTDCGINLLDETITPNLNTSIQAWGDNDTRLLAFFNSLPEGVYTFSYKIRVDAINGTGTNQYGIILNNSQSGQISTRATESTINVGSIFNRSATITITASNKGLFTNCWFYTGRSPKANADSCTFYDVQLELGSTATAYEPYNGTTALINLGGTYYGGSIDAVTGKITLTHGYADLGTLNWSYFVRNTRFVAILDNGKFTNSAFGLNTALCEIYPIVTVGYGAIPDKSISVGSNFISGSTCALVIHDEAYTTVNELTTALSGQHIAYELATPLVVYASNTAEIPTIVGDNQVFADTGDVEVKYRRIAQ